MGDKLAPLVISAVAVNAFIHGYFTFRMIELAMVASAYHE